MAMISSEVRALRNIFPISQKKNTLPINMYNRINLLIIVQQNLPSYNILMNVSETNF